MDKSLWNKPRIVTERHSIQLLLCFGKELNKIGKLIEKYRIWKIVQRNLKAQ